MFSIHDDKADKLGDWTYIVPSEIHQLKTGRVKLILKTIEKDNKNRYWYCILPPVGNGRYDLIKIEGSGEDWSGPSVKWMKEADVKRIEAK